MRMQEGFFGQGLLENQHERAFGDEHILHRQPPFAELKKIDEDLTRSCPACGTSHQKRSIYRSLPSLPIIHASNTTADLPEMAGVHHNTKKAQSIQRRDSTQRQGLTAILLLRILLLFPTYAKHKNDLPVLNNENTTDPSCT